MGSTRLKGKVLKKIMDMPMISLILKRLERSKYIDKVILATSGKNEDTPLYEAVKAEGFEVFRGDEENVLKRYVDCLKQYDGDTVVRITGDCPLIDSIIVDNIISYYQMNDYDYVRLDVPNTFIRGFDVEVFSKESLFKTYTLANEQRYTEHVTYYIYTHPDEFNIGVVKGDIFYNKNYRLCVDTIEDFTLVSKVFENFGDIFISSKEVVKFLDSHPEIAYINKEIDQKTV
jgi:spore coat polysaccharide biosynthesis protein SpsF